MKIKKFNAQTEHEAFQQIKEEFGEDALILNSKRIKDPDTGKKTYEVTAAIDKKEKETALPKQTFKQVVQAVPKAGIQSVNNQQYKILHKEIDYISERIELLVNHFKYENLPHIPKLLQQQVKHLIKSGVSPSLANTMAEELVLHLKGEELLSIDIINNKLHQKIKSRLSVTGPVRFNKSTPTTVMFIGPAGCGKSTTIAKFAAMYKYTYSKKVAIISIDSYRIAAMEQIKAFAQIAKIRFEPAYDNEEMIAKTKALSDFDLIIIDSPGVNTKNVKNMIHLKESARVAKTDEIVLVLSMTTKISDLKDYLKGFGIMNYASIILTKLDDTSSCGEILNLVNDFEKPVSYICFGQNIPEDIAIADRNELASIILRGKYGIS